MALVRDRASEEIRNMIFSGVSVENVSGAEIVCSINHQIGPVQKLSRVCVSKCLDNWLCPRPGVTRVQFSGENLRLRQMQILIVSADEPVKIALLDNILIYQFQVSNSLASEKVCSRTSNASRA